MVTLGLNAKREMLDNGLFAYFKNNIAPLYPNAKDVKGRRVMVMVDSRSGRMFIVLVTYAPNLGFMIVPDVPNSITITGETDLTK